MSGWQHVVKGSRCAAFAVVAAGESPPRELTRLLSTAWALWPARQAQSSTRLSEPGHSGREWDVQTRIVLVRHAAIDNGSRLCGSLDVPLSAAGRDQVRALLRGRT